MKAISTLRNRILTLVQSSPGLTDREITDQLLGRAAGQQGTNQVARSLSAVGRIVRRRRSDGKMGNFPVDAAYAQLPVLAVSENSQDRMLSEDDVKRYLQEWLEKSGWQVSIRWGRDRGVDIEAKRGNRRWIIEAKGCGSLNPMRVNYFLSILGEVLQRMDDSEANYSIALPDMKQFRGLWERLPQVAKQRTKISALFVTSTGEVKQI